MCIYIYIYIYIYTYIYTYNYNYFYENVQMSLIILYLSPFLSPKLYKSMLILLCTKFSILDGVYISDIKKVQH